MKTFEIGGKAYKLGFNFGFMIYLERLKKEIEEQTHPGSLEYNFYMIWCALLGSNPKDCNLDIKDVIDVCNDDPALYVEMMTELNESTQRWNALNARISGGGEDSADGKKKE